MKPEERKAGLDILTNQLSQEFMQGLMTRAKLVNKLSVKANPGNIGVPPGKFGGNRGPRPRMPKP